LLYKNVKLGVIEAKKSSRSYTDGVTQAKQYAELLNVRFTFATNGKKIYQIDMQNGSEHEIDRYPTPDELWNMTYATDNDVFNKLSAIPFNTDGVFQQRYYQENAVNAVIKALSMGKKRILLTLATGTGKTKISYQIVWKLMQARWNLRNIGDRLPRILFLADRNILVNQALVSPSKELFFSLRILSNSFSMPLILSALDCMNSLVTKVFIILTSLFK